MFFLGNNRNHSVFDLVIWMFSGWQKERNTILNKMFVNTTKWRIFVYSNESIDKCDYWTHITSWDVCDCFVLGLTDHSVARPILDWEIWWGSKLCAYNICSMLNHRKIRQMSFKINWKSNSNTVTAVVLLSFPSAYVSMSYFHNAHNIPNRTEKIKN